ncbi:MAG: hypothetical protein J7K57_05835 [Palaeococcus sp.]|uniref:hypothetical protein n=1 Tax=Palaeococcus sp. (in: euryarchaeotes) TaxID=2820298 RepID=UPI0025ED05C2|nr:hypothetical protein [Palaeococcus sp. (in: euryarchaeotes)]MCD6559378.1 hypothetical protein [Palaeococcus sp. (in: euryarchaeotes)]
MSQRIHASMVTKRKYSFHYGIFKIPAWFYSFVPFKIATGGASILLPPGLRMTSEFIVKQN